LHALARGAFGSGKPLLDDLMKKTAALVREHASLLEGLQRALAPVRLDETALAALKSNDGNAKPIVINLGRALASAIPAAATQPYLLEIKQRANDVLERLDDRRTETEQALQQKEALIRQFQEIAKERERLDLDEDTFSFFQTLRQAGLEPASAQEIAAIIGALFLRYPEQRENPTQKRNLKAALYKELMPLFGKEQMVGVAKRLMGDLRA
jgi:hypothetical protein